MNGGGEDNAHDRDLLWGMYADLRTHARHAESLRSNVVNVVLVVASVLIALVFADQGASRGDLPLCLALTAAGGFGTAFVISYTELFRRNRRRAEAFRDRVDRRGLLREVLRAADAQHERTRWYRWGRRVVGSTHRFWLLLPALVMVAGLALALVAGCDEAPGG